HRRKHLVRLGWKPGGWGRRVGAGPVHPARRLLPARRLHAGAIWRRCIDMSSRLLPALVALLLGFALGWGLRSCEEGGERSDGSWEAVAGWSLPRSSGDSTLAVEVERWRAEAEAVAVRAVEAEAARVIA